METIVRKALEKEKVRRYASAADLAADIRRYLNDEPIAARPLSAGYQPGEIYVAASGTVDRGGGGVPGIDGGNRGQHIAGDPGQSRGTGSAARSRPRPGGGESSD